MADQLMSLSKIFFERIFRIPDYQRGYAWGEKEVNDFWNDLNRLQMDKNHYVGVLTLEPVPQSKYNSWVDDTWLINSRNYEPFYIVDGQQRITTSILLINSVLELISEQNINKLNFSSQEEITKKFLFESKDEYKSRTYLFGYEENNPSYEYLITKIFRERSEHSSEVQETTYTSNLEKAKSLFAVKLKKLDQSQLEEIYVKVTQHFLFNTYFISSDIDVYVTFETMNNRGKRLSHLELLKNRLIYLSTLINVDEDNRARLRRNINNCWKDIYHFLGMSRKRQLLDDEFLNAHFRLYFNNQLEEIYKKSSHEYNRNFSHGYMQQNFLLEEYFVHENIHSKLTPQDIFDYIESLKDSVKQWYFINNPIDSDFNEDIKEYLNKVNYLTTNRMYYPQSTNNFKIKVLLLACLKNSENEGITLKLLKALELYLFLRLLYPYETFSETDRYEVDFEDIIIKLQNAEISINNFTEKLNKISAFITSSIEINQKLINFYRRMGFYQTNFLKYFLCEYELDLMKQSKTMIVKLDRDVLFDNGYNSMEHIYPQNAHHKYWLDMFSDFSAKERGSLRNSLGNFVVLSSPKNSKLSNKPFPEKKCNPQNTIGYKYGTYAEIELTDYENWGAGEILERGIKLISFLHRRWGIKIGSGKKIDKKDFLGLSFIK
ncbi:MAG: DUF262 domain-containing HNH endonuclease family protein [Desulfosporosinus sp.]|nr:DUF262 domain-containing HNH endonuclease family protein [Desulfosporosinus sp.]